MMRLILLFLLLGLTTAATAAPRVLASFRPLQLIASELMQGVGEAEALLDARQSPHHFQLRPSQLRQLQQADLLIWISDDFETGLARLQQSLPAGAERLQLMPLLQAKPDETRDQKPDHGVNRHLWLSPRLDARIAERIAERLQRLDPANSALYQRNLDRLQQRLKLWLDQARARLAQARPRYLLDHPFLEPFERDLGIQALGALAGPEGRGGGLRSLRRLEQRLAETPADCLFSADWPADRRSREFARRHGLALVWMPILDPEHKAASIVDLLDSILDKLAECGAKP